MTQSLPAPTRCLWPKALPSDSSQTHWLPGTRNGWNPENSDLGSLASSPIPHSPSNVMPTQVGDAGGDTGWRDSGPTIGVGQ